MENVRLLYIILIAVFAFVTFAESPKAAEAPATTNPDASIKIETVNHRARICPLP